MRYQRNSYSCAAGALQNALIVLGKRVGQGKLARMIGVTQDGADEDDLLDAIHKLDLSVDIFEGSSDSEARLWLLDRASHGPILICVNDWCHWVTVAGVCAGRLLLFDPEKSSLNARENGVWALAPSTVLRRWRASRVTKGDESTYYGIAIFNG